MPNCWNQSVSWNYAALGTRQRSTGKGSPGSLPACQEGFHSLHLVGFQGLQIQGFSITWTALELEPSGLTAPRLPAPGSTILGLTGSLLQVWEVWKPSTHGSPAPGDAAGNPACFGTLGFDGEWGGWPSWERGKLEALLSGSLNQMPWFPSPNFPSKGNFEMFIMKQKKGPPPQVP